MKNYEQRKNTATFGNLIKAVFVSYVKRSQRDTPHCGGLTINAVTFQELAYATTPRKPVSVTSPILSSSSSIGTVLFLPSRIARLAGWLAVEEGQPAASVLQRWND